MISKEFIVDNSKQYIIYGAAKSGEGCLKALKEKSVVVSAFADGDENRWNTTFCDLPIIDLKKLYELDREKAILIVASARNLEIKEQLKNAGFKKIFSYNLELYAPFLEEIEECKDLEFKHTLVRCYHSVWNYNVPRIRSVKTLNSCFEQWRDVYKAYQYLEDEMSKKTFLNILEHRCVRYENGNSRMMDNPILIQEVYTGDQYYLPSYFQFSKDEVFVDGGACQGDSILTFQAKMRNQYKKIYAFEPLRSYYNGMKYLFEKEEKVTIFNKGLYSKNDRMYFTEEAHGSKIDQSGKNFIDTTSIDYIIPQEEEITFIKFDIEGAEKEALLGAEKHIKKDRPKLAICVYHTMEDLWTIPLLIKEIQPLYRLYMRQHLLMADDETVCYATI